MQPTATDATRRVVLVSVCVDHTDGAVQKRLNCSRCRLGRWLTWVQRTMC